jgi:hypothetical protein
MANFDFVAEDVVQLHPPVLAWTGRCDLTGIQQFHQHGPADPEQIRSLLGGNGAPRDPDVIASPPPIARVMS